MVREGRPGSSQLVGSFTDKSKVKVEGGVRRLHLRKPETCRPPLAQGRGRSWFLAMLEGGSAHHYTTSAGSFGHAEWLSLGRLGLEDLFATTVCPLSAPRPGPIFVIALLGQVTFSEEPAQGSSMVEGRLPCGRGFCAVRGSPPEGPGAVMEVEEYLPLGRGENEARRTVLTCHLCAETSGYFTSL